MRRVIIYILVSIICGACSQTAEEIDTAAQKIVFGVEVSAPEARTALVNENGKYKAIWKAGDTFSVVQIADSDSALYSGTVAEDAASIVVNAEFEQSAATKFTYIFASPAATVSADCSYLEMSLPEEQSPAAMNTFDSTSDLILSNAVERESQPNGENVPFIAERISAVGKMTVKNLPLAEGEQVTSVTFTTTQPLAGSISNIKVSDIVAGNDALLNATYLNPKGTITINLPEPQSGEFTLYFSCLPATLPAGSEYSVTVTSTNSTYTKQAQIPSNLSFTAGRMTSFAVNMTDNSQDIASNNKILYTSSDGKIVTPYATDVFGATIVSNSYNNGQGVITFDSDVVTVGEYAFFNCGTLDSITLPEGLCEIKQFAFGSCSALKSINIPDNVVIIEGGAFLNNSIKQFSGKFASEDGLTLVMEKTLVAYASGNTAEHYTIPQSIAVIGRSAFNGSINLTGVTIPNGVVTLEDYAFCNCFKLAQIALPDSVTAIGEDAFFGCDKLVNISLGNGLTTIGCQAFVDCHSLRTVTLPASLTRISAGIFVDCNALETVYSLATTPPEAEYTYWASWTAFGKDNAQLKIYVPAASVEAYKAADGWKEYADAIFADADPANCQILYTSTDGNVVTPYKTDAFGANIVSNTYENGQGVITFDGEVTSIGEAAFYDCRSLTSVTIPDSVTSIGHVAFYRCLHLAEFNGKFASEDKRCLIVDGELKFFAFAGVTEYTTPTNVTSIGCYAFAHSNNLTSITVSNGVNEICTWAFWGCGNLTNINLPNSLTKIGGAVFQDCSSLVSITIPSSLTKIEDSVFKNCTSLQSVYCQPTVPPTASTTMFENNAADRKIYVPASSVEAYKSAQYWSDYADAIFADADPANCQILYTSTDGNVVTPYAADVFGATIVSNTYENGQGVITFDGEVTKIGGSAFRGCTNLKTLNIPSSVTSIERWAFLDCDSLEEFLGSNIISNGRAVVIDGTMIAFAQGGLTSYVLPSEVTAVDVSVFESCDKLTEISLGENIITIGSSAFDGCTGITSITIPQSVTTIGNHAFNSCTKLDTVYVKATTPPTGEDYMFNNNAADRKIYVPAASVDAYKTATGWSNYADAIVAEELKPANNQIFYTSTDGNIVTPYATNVFGANIVSNTYENGQGVIVFDGEVTSIGNYAFYNCRSLTSVTIPDSVTTIGNYAFRDCSSLTSVTIPNSVTTLGINPFESCSKLTEFNGKFASADKRCLIVDGVLNSFAIGCGLTEYAIPNSVTEIGGFAFYDCSRLKSVTIPDSVTKIESWAFCGCSSLTSVTIPDSVTKIGNSAFYGCSSLTSVTIPNSVTKIGSDAFGYCSSLTSVTIPDSVTTLGANPFRSCSKLTEFNGKFASADKRCLIVDGVLNSFAIGCGLTEYAIPNSVTEIGNSAFSGCSSLTSVTIPDSVTSIENYAFSNCRSLKSVYCKPITPPTADKGDYSSWYAFNNNAADRKIYVPASSVEAYKSAQYWSDYADAIVAEGTTSGVVDLSVAGTANCYLVNGAGNYKFKAVKGNSLENFSNGYSADVLWESFGTSTTPNVGDLITNVAYKDGYISFSTPATFKSGNASVALRDSSGKILWSWHIWCSAEGWNDQVYPNNAGTMMDRNLGATSATPGDIGAFGLLYQWGRKDPFMGTCAMSESTLAASTGSWDVASSGNNMDFAVENPMTFATGWYGGGVAGEGWHTSESEKGLYDPCPVGYRLPDGGANGFWATALGTSSNALNSAIMKWTNSGFTWTLADGTTAAWYPAVGFRSYDIGMLYSVGSYGYCWSASPNPSYSGSAYNLNFNCGNVYTTESYNSGNGCSVRCVRE